MVKCGDQLFSFTYNQDTQILEFFNSWFGTNFRLDSGKVAVVNRYIYVIEFGYDSMETTVKRCDAKACAQETLHLFDEVCRGKACNVVAGSYMYIHRQG